MRGERASKVAQHSIAEIDNFISVTYNDLNNEFTVTV
jgi:hypothetical protein